MRVLVVEDNLELSALLRRGLEAAGFDVDVANTGEFARLAIETSSFGVVVLDLLLPDGDGLEILRELRARRVSTPVLILTARGALDDRLSGFSAGADDYLVKPFELEELVARIQALLRRPGELLAQLIRLGDLALDTTARQAFVRDAPIVLTGRELTLLDLLMRRSGRVVLKEHIETQLFGLAGELGSNAVEVLVHRLRRKLESLSAGASIHTVRGLGYLLTSDS